MKLLNLFQLIILLALIAGCNKIDLDEPMDGPVIFSASVEVDGTAKKWEAGINGYYMFTGFDKDTLDVFSLYGRFEKENCQSNCGEKLTIRIRDFQQTTEPFVIIGETIRPNTFYDYFVIGGEDTIITNLIVDTVGYLADFDASASTYPPGVVGFNWDFGDGQDGQANTPFTNHVYDTLQAVRTVTLTVASQNQFCTASLTKQVGLTNQLNNPCSVALELDTTNLDSLMVTALPVGTPPFSFLWDNGATGNSMVLGNPAGQVSASVTVTNASGCTSAASIGTFLNPGINPAFCLAAFDAEVQPDTIHIPEIMIVPGDSLQFSAVTIEYTDAAGIEYSSSKFQQPSESNFEIVKVEDYDNNEVGQKTKKLTVRFACELWDDTGQKVVFKKGEAVIAVAYP